MKGWKNIVLFIVPYFFSVGLFQLVGGLVAGSDFTADFSKATIAQRLVVSFFGLLGTFVVLFFFMRFVDKVPFVNLGFKYQHQKKDIIAGLAFGLLVMGLGFILLVFFNQLIIIETNFLGNEFAITIMLFLIVSVAEETVFRGYILRNLLASMGNFPALLISATLFALIHLGNPNLDWIGYTNLFLAGILLGLPYVYTRNLWFPIALHFSWNFFQTHFGFNVSGQDSYSIIEISIVEKNILNGGDFGFEGSILSTMFQLVLIVSMFIYFKQKNKV